MVFTYPPRKLIPLDIVQLQEIAKKENTCGERARKKLAILKRDGFRCQECGSVLFLTIAHLEGHSPKHRGAGGYKVAECRVLCVSCHLDEEDKKFHHWRFRGC